MVARFARHLPDRTPRDTGLVQIDEQIGDAVMLGRIGLGAHEHEHMRRLHPLRGPDLLPVDDPLAAVGRQFATRPHTREVRSRAGLGIALAPRSEEHTSELQSLMRISYAVFCLKKKKNAT